MSFASDILSGSSVYRALFHRAVSMHCKELTGEILDVAGDKRAVYRSLLSEKAHITTLNIRDTQADVIGDFNKPLPFGEAQFDVVLFFNAIYIVDEPQALMREIRRVLKPGGQLYLASPFISNEMRDPHDYQRLTSEGLERLAKDSGFRFAKMYPFGERFTSAAYLLHPFLLFGPIRLFVYLFALGLDNTVPDKIHRQHPAPLGHFCIMTI